jgi:tetratricopeptide (TPR) repeat protein
MSANPLLPPDATELLPSVLRDVRSGRFGPHLLKDAEFIYANIKVFQDRSDEVCVGRAHSLLWEIYDQAGMYNKALDVIDLAKVYLDELGKAGIGQYRVDREDDHASLRSREVARQRIMCCLANSFALYRRGSYERARAILDQCELFLNQHLIDDRPDAPSPFHCWGALGRLHYFYGQVLRAEADYSRARTRFTQALECTWQRLEEKKARFKASHEKLVVEQLFANHCAAKVLAFGFGWTSLLQGELSRAQEFFQSARVLLTDSEDGYLVSQVELFFCTVLRAKDGSSPDLDALLARMKVCSSNLKGHPEYYLQSLRHLAVAHLNAARAKPAHDPSREPHLREGKRLVREALPLCSDNHEYWVLAKVVASRLASTEGGDVHIRESLTLAEEAHVRACDKKISPRALAEAEIAVAEALSRGTRLDWIRAIGFVARARENSCGSPVVRCVCHLHLTELHLKLDDTLSAVRSFADWETESTTVEHDWLRRKAEALRRQIDKRKLFLVGDADTRNFDDLRWDLIQFLVERERLRQGADGGFDPKQAAKNIGIDIRTLQGWIGALRARPGVRPR